MNIEAPQMPAATTPRGYPWPEFWFLMGAGVLASLAALPYAIALRPAVLERVPLAVLVASQVVNSAVLLAVAVGLGLPAARGIGLRAPLLEAWLSHGDKRLAVRDLALPPAIALGLAPRP